MALIIRSPTVYISKVLFIYRYYSSTIIEIKLKNIFNQIFFIASEGMNDFNPDHTDIL